MNTIKVAQILFFQKLLSIELGLFFIQKFTAEFGVKKKVGKGI